MTSTKSQSFSPGMMTMKLCTELLRVPISRIVLTCSGVMENEQSTGFWLFR